MRIHEMLQDDDAVSPVIGVILMVAITVILAAVIASFVLGLGPGEAAPTASFDFDQSTDEVQVIHANGDKLDPSEVNVTVSHASANVNFDFNPTSYTEIGGGDYASVDISSVPSGETVTIRVVWETADSSQTLDSAEITK